VSAKVSAKMTKVIWRETASAVFVNAEAADFRFQRLAAESKYPTSGDPQRPQGGAQKSS